MFSLVFFSVNLVKQRIGLIFPDGEDTSWTLDFFSFPRIQHEFATFMTSLPKIARGLMFLGESFRGTPTILPFQN